ncbi:polarized growth protein [Colletotrichum truncatum]|uniref:Polarized growth protein n=1 Tax=Colletotrichum truncatum TaxID=5467 RepID=A0ACC3YUY7_COLTU|nr:polarized growth protein [Colletotrichum truncatum]KAF6785910.1 polarized growth protein [Colletotrichum truncatum]
MSLVALLRHGLRLLLPLAVVLNVYLYLYPIFIGCAFPVAPSDSSSGAELGSKVAFLEAVRPHLPPSIPLRKTSARPAPFRLLALGDPQLEGDTAIRRHNGPIFAHARSLWSHVTFQSENSLRQRIRQSLHDLIDIFFEDVFDELESIRKRIDLFGNDFYLAHIYRTVHWWTRPTHVTVLGDLLGSQWIGIEEFRRRGRRYWDRVMRGTERVPDDVAAYPSMEYELSGLLSPSGEPSAEWPRRVINVAGNHDIGYAGDINQDRFGRFERLFGKANYELRFELPIEDPKVNATVVDDVANPSSDRLPPEIRVIILNDMNLDTPAKDADLQDATYAFINSVIETSSAVEYNGHFTVVLTHIPLHKPEGVCVDSPFFDFHGDEDGGGVKEQNLLSYDASKGFLEGIFGMSGNTEAPGNGKGRPGVILNGHDHEGCDTFHYINQTDGNLEDRRWQAQKWKDAKGHGVAGAAGVPGLREITVRSMMGDFGGNAGLFSAWFDEETWSWKFEYATCALGTQHMWWLVHILDLVAVVGIIAYIVLSVLEANKPPSPAKSNGALISNGTVTSNGKPTPANGVVPSNGAVKKPTENGEAILS